MIGVEEQMFNCPRQTFFGFLILLLIRNSGDRFHVFNFGKDDTHFLNIFYIVYHHFNFSFKYSVFGFDR